MQGNETQLPGPPRVLAPLIPVRREVDVVTEGTFGLVAIEIKHTSEVTAGALRPLRDFVVEQKARLGVVITNDARPRLYDDRLIGLPFAWL